MSSTTKFGRNTKAEVIGPDAIPQAGILRLFAKDLAALSGVGYHLDIFEVNAVNYGAPQLRERALFIGNRYGEIVEFPEPTHGIEKSNDNESQRSLFNEDPLLPWIAPILQDKASSSKERAVALFDETMSQLKKWGM